MLKSRIIPCLDVNEGRVVKGVKFQNLRDAGDPVELSFHYQDQGADELVLLDVTATRQERIAMLETIERVRQKALYSTNRWRWNWLYRRCWTVTQRRR